MNANPKRCACPSRLTRRSPSNCCISRPSPLREQRRQATHRSCSSTARRSRRGWRRPTGCAAPRDDHLRPTGSTHGRSTSGLRRLRCYPRWRSAPTLIRRSAARPTPWQRGRGARHSRTHRRGAGVIVAHSWGTCRAVVSQRRRRSRRAARALRPLVDDGAPGTGAPTAFTEIAVTSSAPVRLGVPPGARRRSTTPIQGLGRSYFAAGHETSCACQRSAGRRQRCRARRLPMSGSDSRADAPRARVLGRGVDGDHAGHIAEGAISSRSGLRWRPPAARNVSAPGAASRPNRRGRARRSTRSHSGARRPGASAWLPRGSRRRAAPSR